MINAEISSSGGALSAALGAPAHLDVLSFAMVILTYATFVIASRGEDQQADAALNLVSHYAEGVVSLMPEKTGILLHKIHLVPGSVEGVSREEMEAFPALPLDHPISIEEGSSHRVHLPESLAASFSKEADLPKLGVIYSVRRGVFSSVGRRRKHVRTVEVRQAHTLEVR